MDRSTRSQIDSKKPRNANIFPISFLSGMVVMRQRNAGSMLAFREPSKVAGITNHQYCGLLTRASKNDQAALEMSPTAATVWSITCEEEASQTQTIIPIWTITSLIAHQDENSIVPQPRTRLAHRNNCTIREKFVTSDPM